MIFATVALSARGTWKDRTLPPRSTSVMIARLFEGPPRPFLVNLWPLVVAVRILDAFDTTKKGFVRLDNLAFPTHRRQIKTTLAHRFHDAVMHEPSSVVLAPKGAM